MMRRLGYLVVCVGLVLLGCQQPVQQQLPEADDVASIFLVSHGWHAGLVVPRAAVSDSLWPEVRDFPEASYLEVGWGDSAYYRAEDPGVGTALKAVLWPTPSVLHVVGLRRPVEEVFPTREVIRVDVSAAALDSLASFVHASYARDEQGQPVRLGPGLYGESLFYASRASYHLFRTCNTWAAHALEAAGCPRRAAATLTVGALMRQARGCGTVVQRES